ncbi:uncharacterized protein LOC118469314 [Amphiprion ocellaris]|uniref:uncharacterized protein LOC118469314 n=1 Tax=Amphiprion ocellaris TaxID=80972 RepID=UPI0024110BAC|nr:uncharacterized protein LOC118469314 [Amphiprion ocellaris]
MSAVERRRALEPRLEIRPSRNRHFRRPQKVTSIWLPDSSDSSQRAHRTPIYVSFVSKAILWDRGLRHDIVHDRPAHRPSLCPRFLSHMKARPEALIPPRYLSSKSVQQLPSQGKEQNPPAVAAPKTHMLAGRFHLGPDRRTSGVQNAGLITGRRSAVAVPRLRLPATPPPSTINPTPPQPNTPQPDAEGQQSQTNIAPSTPSCLPPPHPEHQKDEVPVREKLLQPAVVEPDVDLNIRPAGSTLSASPTSLSQGSLSDLSRPPSSLFSRSTDLSSGRSSVLSDKTTADILDLDPEGSARLSPLQPSPTMPLPLTSPAGSNLHQSFSSTKSLLYEPLFGQTKPLSPRQAASFHLNSDKPPSSSRRSTKTAENLHLDPSVGPDLNPSLDSDRGRATPAFRSATWSSCPSPQRTTPHSGSAAKVTPSRPASRLEPYRWPVLPPISPARGRSAASHCSEFSCTQSCVFDELEAIAPLSASCLSLDEPSDLSGSPSPDTDLSPGLAALTVGCDSGNLGSLSRVQLLLLDRLATEDQSPSGLEEEIYPLDDWSDLKRYDPTGVLKPRTAGSISERCDSAGKVRGNKSDQSEGGSESPSSWIIDPSPSFNMFRSSSSPCRSNHSSHTDDDGGPSEEESIHPGWKDQAELLDGGRRPESVAHRTEEKDRRMEERKALSMLSKLQDDTPHQGKSNKSRSNFEDFDFLAKYCIFSQEKLAEYKRAFEAEDSDYDGYISCLQVLLALKTITPPELLSDEEEIYVYRILEMVDFRVTDGLVDLRLFAVIASLAQKIASMDEFMRSLITNMDFRSLEVRLFKAKQLFLFLLEEQRGDAGAQQGFISAEQLLLELKAGGIHLEQEAAVRLELQHVPPLDLLDFLAYLPLFMLIHKAVISNPLNDSSNL